MKHFPMLCSAALLVLSLTACGTNAGSASASSSAPTAPSQTRGPTVTISKVTEHYKSDDGNAVLLNSEWNTATVSIPGNEGAQAAIQSDLDQILETFQATSQAYRQEAETLYQEGEPTSIGPVYRVPYRALSITRARCDGDVISLVIDETSYTGGAHGSDYRYARNYDVTTGQVLQLTDLGGGVGDVASDKITQFINQIHELNGLFFSKVKETDLMDLVTDDLFYFDQSGLVFIAGQYSFQSYAEGIVEFTISYDDLTGTLTDTYNLGGGVTRCSTGLGIYTFREDGSLDTSQIYYGNPSPRGDS